MSSTSAKHRDFVGEPMGEKKVTAVAGIGPVYGERLSEKGFDKAYLLLGKFLLLRKDEELFKDWLKETCYANVHYSNSAYTCLKEWSKSYI